MSGHSNLVSNTHNPTFLSSPCPMSPGQLSPINISPPYSNSASISPRSVNPDTNPNDVITLSQPHSPSQIHSHSPSPIPPILALHRPCSASTHTMVTRSNVGIFKPKCFDVSMSQEPSLVAAALLDSNWKQPMLDEYNALIRNNTWTLVPFSEGMNVVDNKWAFRLKLNPDGSIQCYKARLATKGFQQTTRVDFNETFSHSYSCCFIQFGYSTD